MDIFVTVCGKQLDVNCFMCFCSVFCGWFLCFWFGVLFEFEKKKFEDEMIFCMDIFSINKSEKLAILLQGKEWKIKSDSFGDIISFNWIENIMHIGCKSFMS